MKRLPAYVLCVLLIAAVGCTPEPIKTDAQDPEPADAPEKPKDAAPAATVEPTAEDKALAAEFRHLTETLEGPATIEPLNWTPPDWWLNYVRMLAGEKPAKAEPLAKARTEVGNRVKDLRMLKDFPPPQSFTMQRAAGKIVVDGKLNEDAWKKAEKITRFWPLNGVKPLAESGTVFQMCRDDENLYFAFTCEDEEIDAPELDRDGPVYNYDCVELFLLPSRRWGQYWELNLSPSGSLLDFFHTKYRDKWGSYARQGESVEGLKFASTKTGPDDKPTGYIVEAAVPIDQLPAWHPDPSGATLYLLAARVDRDEGKLKFQAFTPVSGWFHNIWVYAPVKLAK